MGRVMTNNKIVALAGALGLGITVLGAKKMQKFEPTWESLQQYKCPEWFRDAKFGIFLHWGPTSVPGFGTPYSRDMYEEGSYAYKHHIEHYGHPSKFGWKDIIPLWKAEKWDPDYTVGVFKDAGAKYIVPVASFHDNFDLWNSKYTKWNAVNMGPKKDIIKLWRDATLKADLRFGVSEHLERSYSWFNTNKGRDKDGPLAGVPYDGNDTNYADFYFPPHDDTAWFYPRNPPEWWKQEWYNRIEDLVDNYKPDLLYTDGGLPFGDYGRKLMAHFYNANMLCHTGRLDAVYNLKNIGNHGEYREGICVEDLERGTMDYLKKEPWQTDTAIGDWFYNQNDTLKSSHQLITMLVDIVSKNGNLLLDVSLKADGTIPDGQLERLKDIGAWMKVNGDAIYGTRPWTIYGEGPNAVKGNHFNEGDVPYTAADIRFTTHGNVIDAIALGWPDGDHFLIKALDEKAAAASGGIAGVRMLGVDEPVEWKLTSDGLWIRKPARRPCEHAFVFQITVKGTR